MAKKQEEEKPKKVTIIKGDNPALDNIIPNRSVHSTWETPESFSRHIRTVKQGDAWHSGGWEHGEEFGGTEDMDEALALADAGWPEGAHQVEKMLHLVQASNPTLSKTKKYSMAGSAPNVPRAIAGNPVNMRTVETALSRRRPVITILHNMCAHCHISKESITNRAAVVATIIDRIEAAGYSCEVIATALSEGGSLFSGGESGFTVATSVVVKKAGQAVDLGRLAFGLGHASMFRRMVFADWGGSKDFKNLGHGLGHGDGLTNEEKRDFRDKKIYTTGSASENTELFSDEKTCATEGLQYIIGLLKEQGCPAFAG